MNLLPSMHQIKSKAALQDFAKVYQAASGLPIPDAYLYNPNHRVFGIIWQNELIGGFILGNGPEFRTIEVFAQADQQDTIYNQLEEKSLYTEICCFWIKRSYRTKNYLNFFIWFAMAYALKRYGSKYFLFGTCSRSLARLYSQTSKSILIHEDCIKRKATFIFWAKRSSCLKGMLEIIHYKLKRALKITGRSNATMHA